MSAGRLPLLLRGAVSAATIGWLLAAADLGGLAGALRGLAWPSALLALAVAVGGYCLWPLRLGRLLAAQGVREGYGSLLRLTFAGVFFGNVLPSTLGSDAVKLGLLLGRHPGRRARVTLSVVADRSTNVLATLLLLGAVGAVPGLLSPGLDLAGGLVRWGCAAAAAGAAALLVALPRLRERLHRGQREARAAGREPGGGRLRRLLHEVVHALADWAAAPRALAAALALSLLSTLAFFEASRTLAAGLGVRVGVPDWIAVQGLLSMIGILPVSLNGIGVQEVGVVLLLGRLGVDAEPATAFALLNRALFLVATLPGAVALPGRRATPPR